MEALENFGTGSDYLSSSLAQTFDLETLLDLGDSSSNREEGYYVFNGGQRSCVSC